MPEKTQKRKLRSDQSTSQMDVEIASSTNDENVLLSDRDFEDISSKVENRFSKRLRDTEVNQREILKLIENLSSKVDNLANVNPGQNSLTFETGISEIPNDELEEVEPARSVNSNTPRQWLERFRQFTKREHKIDITPLIKGEDITEAGWTAEK